MGSGRVHDGPGDPCLQHACQLQLLPGQGLQLQRARVLPGAWLAYKCVHRPQGVRLGIWSEAGALCGDLSHLEEEVAAESWTDAVHRQTQLQRPPCGKGGRGQSTQSQGAGTTEAQEPSPVRSRDGLLTQLWGAHCHLSRRLACLLSPPQDPHS